MRALRTIHYLITLVLLIPAISSGEQFKITEVYDGSTVRAEGYDRQCLP